jgi:hypothetical protein
LQELEPEIQTPEQTSQNEIPLNERLRLVEEKIQSFYDSPRVEEEEVTLSLLTHLGFIAKEAIDIRGGRRQSIPLNLRQSSAGAILSLAREPPKKKPVARKPATKEAPTSSEDDLPSPDHISTLATDLLKHEKVFISPTILSRYIDLQRLVRRPRSIPEILHLYAHKPVPVLNSSPPKFSQPNPKGHKQAVPKEIAERALSAAIAAKDLPLALNVIDATYCTPAWRRHKILTKVVPPATLATLTPLALYTIAQEMSLYSGYIDPWTFKIYCFTGMLTYVMCTGTLGFVAMTTHNDHFDRVVWRPGVPLTTRWLREDERAALDRIAGAWGFKESWKRGDEEGEEWEGLREWILLRGMILDKSDLMPGMNA